MQSSFEPSVLKNLEEEIRKIHLISSENHSIKLKLLNYIPLFEKLIEIPNENVKESYITELINDFNHTLHNSSFEGLPPEIINRIKFISLKLYDFPFVHHTCPSFINSVNKISDWSEKLDKILNGNNSIETDKNIFIPLLENSTDQQKPVVGLLETLTVKITKTKNENKFLIVPSEKELEQLIDEQIKISWNVAINYAKNFIKKLEDNHEIVIHFNKRSGFCRGNSLGAALTIKLIEELLNLYNPKFIIESTDGLALTGGLDELGNILSVGKKTISQKTELIFYSTVNQFVVPKDDEPAAREKLNTLKTIYPERNLKIVAVENLEDLLNRRNIIAIRQQKAIVRAGKFIKQNIYSVFVVVILTILFTYLFALDFDDNPSFITMDGKNAYIKNKNGKTLWSINYPIDDNNVIDNPRAKQAFFRVIDIDEDGENEIIYIHPQFSEKQGTTELEKIICINKNKEELWSYRFADTVFSEREDLPPIYGAKLIDTVTFNGNKILFCYSNNAPTFSSAVYGLELKTGERIPETLWGSGHTMGAILKDINNDNVSDLVMDGIDNGFEDGIICGVELSKMDGYRPTTNEYRIKNKKQIEPIFYIRIPKIDYDRMMNFRTISISPNYIYYRENDKRIITSIFTRGSHNINTNESFGVCNIELDSNYRVAEIVIGNNFRVFRDTLVAQGKLSPPYTDTKEYKEIIKNSILYWKDGKWVKREELDSQ
jgi:hypothetical protein